MRRYGKGGEADDGGGCAGAGAGVVGSRRRRAGLIDRSPSEILLFPGDGDGEGGEGGGVGDEDEPLLSSSRKTSYSSIDEQEVSEGGGEGGSVGGRGFHSPTSQLNLSRFYHWNPKTTHRISQRCLR